MPTTIRRTSMNLDVDLVREAGEALGTSRTTDTVHEAMRQVVLRERRRRLADNDLPDLSLAELERLRRAREH
jgi:Arc/MetJ family transcription regulator